MLAYVNGKIIPADEAQVSINDRGWLYGDAVFETLRTYNRRVFKFAEHLERLDRSAKLVGIEIPMAAAEINAAVDRLLAAEQTKKNVMIRVTVSRGAGGVGLYPPVAPTATVVIQLRPLPDYPLETFSVGWSLIIAKTRRNAPDAINPLIKSANFLNNVLAKKEAVEAGVNEALMLNPNGVVAESTVSNVFMVKNNAVVTPPLTDGILPGITRQTVLSLAAKAGLAMSEKSIAPAEICAADEVFLTLTSAGLIPVTTIDGCSVGEGLPGPVTGRLRQLYDEYVDEWKTGLDEQIGKKG